MRAVLSLALALAAYASVKQAQREARVAKVVLVESELRATPRVWLNGRLAAEGR